MESVYAAENAVSVRCRGCRRPIDVWLRHGLLIRREGAIRQPTSQQLCPDCLLLTCPADERENLARLCEHHWQIVREAGIPPSVTTYPLHNKGESGNWSDGFLACLYGVHVLGWDSESVLRQPYLTIMPGNPSESPFSLVFFAAEIRHLDVKLSYLKCIWPFHDLTLPERFEVVNGLDTAVLDSDLDKLMRGRHFLWKTLGRGRRMGTGRYAPGEESEFLKDLERVLTVREQDGVKIANTQMLADNMGMGKTALFDMFKRAPGARERFKQHGRGPIHRS